MSDDKKTNFFCSSCKMEMNYDYFGNKPPFCKTMVLLEECYIMKDPFSESKGIIILGSHCSVCSQSVCAAQNCSLFYTKRFCLSCVQENLDEFPEEILQELSRRNKEKT